MAQPLRAGLNSNLDSTIKDSWRHDRIVLANLADYEWLTSAEAATYLEQLADAKEPVHRQLQRLRKTLSAERAGLLVQQCELRERGKTKFGEYAAKMFFTDIGLQQSTDLWIARYKASRIGECRAVVDGCTGIGGDLLAFAARGTASGRDSSEGLACLANANLQAVHPGTECEVCVGQVEDHPPAANEAWHLDPDRRSEDQRSTQLKWHSPGPELIEQWLQTSPSGALKLAPASRVPEPWAGSAELEWISRDRECRQQVVWFGEFASEPAQRRATTVASHTELPDAHTFVGNPDVDAPLTDQIGEYVYDTDPAIRAAGLTGAIGAAHDLSAFNEGVSYLTNDVPVEHALLARFRVQEVLPLRTSTITKHLQTLGIGKLEIKKRDVEADLARLRKQLKLKGDRSATLMLTSLGPRKVALLTDREG